MINRPTIVRVLPFLLFIVLLAAAHRLENLQATGSINPAWDLRWLYGFRVIIPALLLAYFWKDYVELRDRLPVKQLILSIVVGILVFALWINLIAPWMLVGTEELSGGFVGTTNQHLDWPLIIMRSIGAALLVPVIEELFWRSFLLRVIDRSDFLSLSPKNGSLLAFFASSAVFAVEHQQWFAGFLAGLAYAGIYRVTANLKTAIIAHAVTNGLLAAWVVYTQAWYFW